MFFKHFFKSGRVYLDFASSTPVDHPMCRTFPALPVSVVIANPSALHKEGQAARMVVESARAKVAHVLNAHRDEIIFTSGATESDNLAIRGIISSWVREGVAPEEIAIASSSLEHAAVSESVASVHPNIFRMTIPAPEGVVDVRGLRFDPVIKRALVSVMYVNNEIGTLQPIKEIAKVIRRLRKERPEMEIVFHVDATQAPLYYSLDVTKLGIDLMTLGATKLYAPKGVGVLYKRRSVSLDPILYGGGQEFGLRPGTEPVELIHTFAHALSYAEQHQAEATTTTRTLQHYFESAIQERFPHIQITASHLPRTPHITHLAIPHLDSELLVIELDARGVAVSAKSACKNEETGESRIVEALYGTGVGAVRFSFGRTITKRHLDHALRALESVLRKYHHTSGK